MAQCPICKSTISRDDKTSLDCGGCKLLYHGRCCNFKDSDVEALGALKKSWICPKCERSRKVIPPGERQASPMKPTTPSAVDPMGIIIEKLKYLTQEIDAIKAALPSSVGDDLRDVKCTLEKQGQIIFDYSDSLKNIESRLENQNKIFEGLILENNTLKARVKELETGLNRAEQELRSRSLEIRGVPVRAGEVPETLVTSIGAGLGLKLGVEDLDIVERLRPRKDDPRPPVIIAKFVKQSVRDELVRLRKVRRDFSTRHIGWEENDAHPIYVSEDMSPTNRRLYYLARQKRAAGKVKYVWFGGGRVRCRRDDGHPVIIINTPEDLDIFT